MLKKLEEIKKLGAYEVSLYFGEDIGCDDMDVPTKKRRVIVKWTPVGCLGGQRVLWNGTVATFLKFDFKKSKKKVLSNPPSREDVYKPGYYTWGTDL